MFLGWQLVAELMGEHTSIAIKSPFLKCSCFLVWIRTRHRPWRVSQRVLVLGTLSRCRGLDPASCGSVLISFCKFWEGFPELVTDRLWNFWISSQKMYQAKWRFFFFDGYIFICLCENFSSWVGASDLWLRQNSHNATSKLELAWSFYSELQLT